MSSLDRLQRMIDVAQHTGDTLIIADASAKHDLVIMPFDRYEQYVTEEEGDTHSPHDDFLFEDMSEGELIDKINRDIAIWRSYQELNRHEERGRLLDNHLRNNPLEDPFEEDYAHNSEWHSVGDVVERHRAHAMPSVPQSTPHSEEPAVSSPSPISESETAYVPYDSVVGQEAELSIDESLSDGEEPVFFEEPIS